MFVMFFKGYTVTTPENRPKRPQKEAGSSQPENFAGVCFGECTLSNPLFGCNGLVDHDFKVFVSFLMLKLLANKNNKIGGLLLIEISERKETSIFLHTKRKIQALAISKSLKKKCPKRRLQLFQQVVLLERGSGKPITYPIPFKKPKVRPTRNFTPFPLGEKRQGGVPNPASSLKDHTMISKKTILPSPRRRQLKQALII